MELISDGLLFAAALAAIFYCWAISSRLGTLKRQSGDLAKRLDDFNASLAEAGKVIASARDTADAEGNAVKNLVVEARALQQQLEVATNALQRASKRSAQVAKERSDTQHDADLLENMKRLANRRRTRNAS